MVPYAPPREPATRDCLALLDEVERRWRDALSHVHADDPQRALAETDRTGEILAHLGRLDEVAELLDPAALEGFTDRMQRLALLHQELIAVTRRAQTEVGRALARAEQGRTTLGAYASGGIHDDHCCDEVG